MKLAVDRKRKFYLGLSNLFGPVHENASRHYQFLQLFQTDFDRLKFEQLFVIQLHQMPLLLVNKLKFGRKRLKIGETALTLSWTESMGSKLMYTCISSMKIFP